MPIQINLLSSPSPSPSPNPCLPHHLEPPKIISLGTNQAHHPIITPPPAACCRTAASTKSHSPTTQTNVAIANLGNPANLGFLHAMAKIMSVPQSAGGGVAAVACNGSVSRGLRGDCADREMARSLRRTCIGLPRGCSRRRRHCERGFFPEHDYPCEGQLSNQSSRSGMRG